MAELVKRYSHLRLHIAGTGGEGVAMATQLQPDLIPLDMQLPDFDGFEVMRRMRQDARLAVVPVIALSANAMPQDIERRTRGWRFDLLEQAAGLCGVQPDAGRDVRSALVR